MVDSIFLLERFALFQCRVTQFHCNADGKSGGRYKKLRKLAEKISLAAPAGGRLWQVALLVGGARGAGPLPLPMPLPAPFLSARLQHGQAATPPEISNAQQFRFGHQITIMLI